MGQIIQGDSVELIKAIPDKSVHLILSDIPYGISFDPTWDTLHDNQNSALGGTSPGQLKAGAVFKHRGKPIQGWSEADRNIGKEYGLWVSGWAQEWLRVLVPGGNAIVFAGRRYSPRCVVAMEDAGFCLKDQLAWIKPKAAHRAQRVTVALGRRGVDASRWEGWRLGNLRPVFEPILWFVKGYDKTIIDNLLEYQVGAFNEVGFGTSNNIIECGMASGEGGLHVAQKPVELMKRLIQLTTVEGQTVLDPFAGSGTVGVAAEQLKRDWVVMDRDVGVMRKRLIYG